MTIEILIYMKAIVIIIWIRSDRHLTTIYQQN